MHELSPEPAKAPAAVSTQDCEDLGVCFSLLAKTPTQGNNNIKNCHSGAGGLSCGIGYRADPKPYTDPGFMAQVKGKANPFRALKVQASFSCYYNASPESSI